MDHKIICWGDYAIPVPINAKWLAFDEDGSAWFYSRKPKLSVSHWSGGFDVLCEDLALIPPEPGPWDTQLYYLD